MPRFMDIHTNMSGVTAETLRAEHEKDLAAQRSEKGVSFIKAWADPKAGKVFCLSEGPNREAVQRVHQRAGHPAQEIYEVSLEQG
jgi:hypothetical protein